MTLGSWTAFALTAITFALYWTMPARARPWLLVAASYVFYAYAFPAYALLLAGLTVGAFLLGRRLRERREYSGRAVLACGTAAALMVLAVFKYSAFVAETGNAMWAVLGLSVALPVPAWAAPLGISFVTFALIHFLAEMRNGEAEAPTFAEFAAYLSFFPTVTSGPIKRYPQFMADSRGGAMLRPVSSDVAYGLYRILLGCFRKFVVADTIGVLAEPLYSVQTNTPLIVIAVYAYAFKIYFDFAGYSDIAIGTARLFGFTVMENFNGPYLRRNIREFWRTWHASLTRFITEYIYHPLGGSRHRRVRTVFNMLVAMTLSGLWHGPAWHFVLWGVWHGVGLAVLRLWMQTTALLRRRVRLLDRIAATRVGRFASYAFGWAVTFNYVVLGWVLFVLPVRDSLEVYGAIARYAREIVRGFAGGVL